MTLAPYGVTAVVMTATQRPPGRPVSFDAAREHRDSIAEDARHSFATPARKRV